MKPCPNQFPLYLVRAALKLKIHDLRMGHVGPIVAVIWSTRYHQPMLSFCDSPQKLPPN